MQRVTRKQSGACNLSPWGAETGGHRVTASMVTTHSEFQVFCDPGFTRSRISEGVPDKRNTLKSLSVNVGLLCCWEFSRDWNREDFGDNLTTILRMLRALPADAFSFIASMGLPLIPEDWSFLLIKLKPSRDRLSGSLMAGLGLFAFLINTGLWSRLWASLTPDLPPLFGALWHVPLNPPAQKVQWTFGTQWLEAFPLIIKYTD